MDYQGIDKCLPVALAEELIGSKDMQIEELRMRKGQPVMLYSDGQERALRYICTKDQIEETVLGLSGHSLHSYSEDIKNGFFSIEGGIRIGLGGRVVAKGSDIHMMRDFTSINIRFPHERKGVSKKLMPYVEGGLKLLNTLIVSAPQYGKTTLLRDIVRAVSEGEGVAAQKCIVIDERGEIYAESFDLGRRTDVLFMCPKAKGMYLALRTLSPEVIATDEVGGQEDLAAIFEAANSGVTVICTAHARSPNELKNKYFFSELMDKKIIDRYVYLSEELGRGTLQEVLDANQSRLLERPIKL